MSESITIFFTGDIHGRDKQSARLYNLYKRERERAEAEGRLCLFFDSGDPSDRSVDYCGLTKCSAYGQVLNAFKYDALTVGNDIGLVYGTSALQKALEVIEPPVLGANYRNGREPVVKGLKEHIIIRRNKVNIGVFGLTNPWGTAYETHGLKFPDALECASEQVHQLKEEGADVIVLLSHMGIMEEMEILLNVPDIQIVIGGHSHTRTPSGVFSNRGTIFHHSGEYAENLGRLDFEFSCEENKLKDLQASLIPIPSEEEEAPEILQAIEAARNQAAHIGKEIIGYTEQNLDLNYWEGCGLGHFSADALREFGEAEIGILASGNLSSEITSGRISMAQLSKACFSTSNPCISRVKGKAIRKLLEKGLDEELSRYYHHGLRGAPVGIPQISGMTVKADRKRIVGDRILEVKIAGQNLADEKTYKVAHTDLEIHKILGYFPDEGYTIEEMDSRLFLKDVLEKKLRSNGKISQSDRWIFI